MLDPAEKDLARSVEARLTEEIAFLEKVVNIDSGTLNVAGVREVGRCFQDELEALGFATRWIAMPRFDAPGRTPRRGARPAGQGFRKRVLLKSVILTRSTKGTVRAIGSWRAGR